jgi:hypothetical protein
VEIDVQITGLEQLKTSNDALYQDLQDQVFHEMQGIAREERGVAFGRAPSFAGTLRAGIRTRSSRRFGILMAGIRAGARHSWLVQHGRRPGRMPSVDPAHAQNPRSAQRLRDWADAHDIDPFILARAIAKRGTRAHPFMPTVAEAEQLLQLRIPAVVERVLAKHQAG